jgi:hypothetical protein
MDGLPLLFASLRRCPRRGVQEAEDGGKDKKRLDIAPPFEVFFTQLREVLSFSCSLQ